ncbi:dihydropteroate synthase [Verruconis gallopava]|uniref:Folic acid synthesis protein FOL1 n=1 Tax=Verruconis gallopava TaxID=253628 RepID=A0A0D1XTR5_9PEZI|nr:dihydropteroate synthase [Verruconis gallopava]KIW06161.1 dihydropteroate synthase [Verruconis gallopava]
MVMFRCATMRKTLLALCRLSSPVKATVAAKCCDARAGCIRPWSSISTQHYWLCRRTYQTTWPPTQNKVTRTSSRKGHFLSTTSILHTDTSQYDGCSCGVRTLSPNVAVSLRAHIPASLREIHTSSTSRTRVTEPFNQHMMKYVIAFGSNMGDRFHWIERACREMEEASIHIYATSGLWQTKAMYVEDQDDFLNGVCMAETFLEPIELMKVLQAIESKMGRVKLLDKGPRNIDLDIILWERGQFRSLEPDLTIPHPLMEERDFVLAPLCQLLPTACAKESSTNSIPETFIHNRNKQPYRVILEHLWNEKMKSGSSPILRPINPCTLLGKAIRPIVPSEASKKTHVMSILNVTPDSFSDGGQHVSDDKSYLHSTILSHLRSGATIIDLGGQSSRPGAPDVSAADEIARLRPALEVLSSLREDPSTPSFAISVDTYRASVAAAAIQAGADIVNDISAGAQDERMLSTVADLGCTYVIMHMRGTPQTMSSRKNTTYDDDLVTTIRDELLDRVIAAENAGIRRWRIILDPGIGFAKTAVQNLEILRRAPEFTSANGRGRVTNGAYRTLDEIPWLFGSSRKGFIGAITGVKEASERTWGTAATVAAAVHGGADIVRVHDVEEMTQVTRMSEAIWRRDIVPAQT